MQERPARGLLKIGIKLRIHFMIHTHEALAIQLLKLAVVDDLDVNHMVALEINPRLEIDADEFNIAETGLESRLDDLAHLLFVHLSASRLSSDGSQAPCEV